MGWLNARDVVPAVRALRQKFEKIRIAAFDRKLEKMATIPERERAQVLLLAQALVCSLLRAPIGALMGEADAGRRLGRAEAVRQLFGLNHPEQAEPTARRSR